MEKDKAKRIALAIAYAAEAHYTQLDKGGNPYILHPIAVMQSMDVEDVEGRIVAVLHDVVEDCEKYGFTLDRVSNLVHLTSVERAALDAITKRKGESNKDYWARCKANEVARRVKLKDMEHNVNPARLAALSYEEQDYLSKKYREAKEYFANG